MAKISVFTLLETIGSHPFLQIDYLGTRKYTHKGCLIIQKHETAFSIFTRDEFKE